MNERSLGDQVPIDFIDSQEQTAFADPREIPDEHFDAWLTEQLADEPRVCWASTLRRFLRKGKR